MKHLDFDLLLVRDQGVGGSNPLSPTILSNELHRRHWLRNPVLCRGLCRNCQSWSRLFVAVTDSDWFRSLSRRAPDEVNFWQPSGGMRWRNRFGLGFTVDLMTLGGTSQSGGEQTIDTNLASGRKSGYTFTYTAGEKINGAIRSYTVTAVPDQVGTTGQRRFFSDESGEVHYNAGGSADTTSPVIQ